MLKRATILAFTSFLLVGPAPAADLDPQSRTPYDLHIVLHLSNHRLLTPVFRDRLERELRDSLREALGELARVHVFSDHPMLAAVLSQGLEKGLDDWKDPAPAKTHFVLVDYVGDNYEIQARQHDGLTGLLSPLVRTDRTRDREFVAKAAALLVAQDFGMIGTLQLPTKPRGEVKVDLKAGRLAAMEPWVRVGDVFWLVQVSTDGKCQQVPYHLLQVQRAPTPENPECLCRLFQSRDYILSARAGVAGYRCLKIDTGEFPVRVRVVQAAADNNNKDWTVEIRRNSFDGKDFLRGNTENGNFDTVRQKEGLYKHLAFVSVQIVAGVRPRVANVPVALINDRVQTIRVPAAGEDNDLFRFHLDGWIRGVAASYMVQNALLQEIKDLGSKLGKRQEALELAGKAASRFRADIQQLKEKRDFLLQEYNQIPEASRPDLAVLTPSEERLKRIEKGESDLLVFKNQLENIEREENDPRRKDLLTKLATARDLEGHAELGKAIAIIKDVISQGMDTPALKDKLTKLEALWKPVNRDHANARKFIYDDWSHAVGARDLGDLLPRARKELEVCKQVGDLVGPKKLLDATVAHGPRLEQELSKLNPVNPDDEKQIELIKDVNAGLEKLAKDADAYLAVEANK